MKGIIMSAPMVRALIDNRKTQTRRVISSPLLQYEDGTMSVGWSDEGHAGPAWYAWSTEYPEDGAGTVRPPYQPGETVYVKEAWRVSSAQDYLAPAELPHGLSVEYIADGVTYLRNLEEKLNTPTLFDFLELEETPAEALT